jgi:hypothetical protein
MISDVIRYTQILNHSTVVTTDATVTELANLAIDNNTAGMLIIDVVSVVTDGSAHNAGRYAVKFISDTGLTIGTLTNIYESNGVAIAVTVVNDGSGNISIRGTGIAATEIQWTARTQLLDQTFSGGAL